MGGGGAGTEPSVAFGEGGAQISHHVPPESNDQRDPGGQKMPTKGGTEGNDDKGGMPPFVRFALGDSFFKRYGKRFAD